MTGSLLVGSVLLHSTVCCCAWLWVSQPKGHMERCFPHRCKSQHAENRTKKDLVKHRGPFKPQQLNGPRMSFNVIQCPSSWGHELIPKVIWELASELGSISLISSDPLKTSRVWNGELYEILSDQLFKSTICYLSVFFREKNIYVREMSTLWFSYSACLVPQGNWYLVLSG